MQMGQQTYGQPTVEKFVAIGRMSMLALVCKTIVLQSSRSRRRCSCCCRCCCRGTWNDIIKVVIKVDVVIVIVSIVDLIIRPWCQVGWRWRVGDITEKIEDAVVIFVVTTVQVPKVDQQLWFAGLGPAPTPSINAARPILFQQQNQNYKCYLL